MALGLPPWRVWLWDGAELCSFAADSAGVKLDQHNKFDMRVMGVIRLKGKL